MVVTNDTRLARKVRQIKGQGQDFDRRYWFPIVGYNYRMTNIQAAIGLAQLELIDRHLAARDEIDAWYRAELADNPEIRLPPSVAGRRDVCWLFSLIMPRRAGQARDRVMSLLRDSGIDSRPFFYPCHTLPPYLEASAAEACPQAIWLAERGISLPTWVGISHEQVTRVCRALEAAIRDTSSD